MKNLNKLLTIIFLVFTVNSVKAQYTGGDNDGKIDGLLSQSACPDLTPNFVYYGGNNDGYSDGTLTQSACTDLTPNFVFYGGINDGYGDGNLTQTICPDPTPNFVFYGGINDGYGDGNLTQTICPDPTPNFVFYGGINDGYGDGNLTQTICPDPTPNFVFYGGNADAFSFAVNEQNPCPGMHLLPIGLLSFSAEKNKSTVDIKWNTASEINNDYFTVERSKDAIQFSTLVNVPGSGNSNSEKNYAAKDNSPYNGISYYRLKQTDFDGKFEYSDIVAVDFLTDEYGISIYPNPSTNELTIEISGNKVLVNFEIINSIGVVVYQGILNQKMTIQTSSFAAGIYVIKFANDYVSECKKLIKQ